MQKYVDNKKAIILYTIKVFLNLGVVNPKIRGRIDQKQLNAQKKKTIYPFKLKPINKYIVRKMKKQMKKPIIDGIFVIVLYLIVCLWFDI